MSQDSVGAGASAASILAQLGNGRASQEKSRIKLFGGRSSTDLDRSETPRSFDEDGRSGSFDLAVCSIATSASSVFHSFPFPFQDEEAQREFDELMRSSTTMKVSLTPDRLKSMEVRDTRFLVANYVSRVCQVYKQERRRKAPGQESENDPVFAMDGGGGGQVKRAVSARRAQARLVDAITEDDESNAIKALSSPTQAGIVPRTRQKSMTAAVASPPSEIPPAIPRSRSVTISNPQVLVKKRSVGQIKPGVPQVPASILVPHRQNSAPPEPLMQNGRPQRTRKMGRRRESMDLDDIMGGDDDQETPIMTPPRTPSAKRDPSKPYVSKTARELIDFLDEGPPPQLEPPNMNASVVSLESSRSKSGRLHRMMSKLSLGGSSEKLNGRGNTVSDSARRLPAVNGTPPSSYLQSSISSRNGRVIPAVVVATPPPPPSAFTSPSASYSSASAPTTFSSSPSVTSSPSFSPNGSISGGFPPPISQSEFPSTIVIAAGGGGGGTPQTPTTETPFPEVRTSSRRTSIQRKAVPTLDAPRDRRDSPSPIQTHILPLGGGSSGEVNKVRLPKASSPLDEFPTVPTTPSARPSPRLEMMSAKLSSSSTSSPVSTAPPSPSASLRRREKQQQQQLPASSKLVAIPVPNGVSSGRERERRQRQISTSPEPQPGPEPEPELEREVVEVETPVAAVAIASTPSLTDSFVDENAEKGQKTVPSLTTSVSASTGALTADDAHDLRRLLSGATSADECRLLVDMFLVKSGYPVLSHGHHLDGAAPVSQPVTKQETERAVEEIGKVEAANEEMERSLVMHFLGGFDDADVVEAEAIDVSSD